MESESTLSNSLSAPLLTVQIEHWLGGMPLNAKFSLTQPWTVLFGPSGSGKTTILRSIAGFVRPDSGRIESRTQVLFDSATKVFVPAHRRPVRCAGQTPRLFPHMSVRRNLLYGNGWTSKPADVMGIAEELLVSFGLKEFADRMPDQLSGGEQRRALVARAVIAAITYDDGLEKPLLLLDEPFSGLDIAARDQLLIELSGWLRRWKIPLLSVTHNLGEAFQMNAEVIKITEGRVVQQGPVAEVLSAERERLLEQLNAAKGSPA
jgi:molybdate transport system ATP-binding protein